MKIVLVMDQFDVEGNGTTVSAKRFAEELERKGNEVRVVTTGEPAPNRYIVKTKHKDLVAYFAKKQKMVIGKPDKEIFKKAFDGADVVHFLLPLHLAMVGKKVADQMGIPTTAAFHLQPENITYNIGMGNIEAANDLTYRLLRDMFYKKFDYIHCPSEFIANELRKHGYKADIRTISNGVDPIFTKDENFVRDEKFGDKFVILMIGRYSPEKKQEVLIDAISKSKYEKNIQLVLAGAGPCEEEYKELASEKLTNEPIFGFVEKSKMPDLIRSSDLYVHSSEIEIEAIACIEAFACGVVPVIANSPKSATKQFALDDRSLFKVNDSDDLASKIDYWYENRDEKKKMGQEYANSANKYRLDKSVDQILEMFEDAIKSKRNNK